MTRIAAAVRRRLAADDGITLVELVVSMALMSVLGAIVTGGMIALQQGATRSEEVYSAQARLDIVFQRLDKEIRYATGISREGEVGGDKYIEYLNSSTGKSICTELRLNTATRQLQRRTWTQGAVDKITAWSQLATGVSGGKPFTFVAADATANFQRLRLTLSADAAKGAATALDVQFTALNTSLTTTSDNVCNEGRTAK